MEKLTDFILGLSVLLGMLGAFIWLMVRWWRKSEDRSDLAMRWGFTFLDGLFLVFIVIPLILRGGYTAAFGGIPMAAVAGIILAIVWTPSITGYFARRVGMLYDGGDLALEPGPLYSIAIAKRKRGDYREAVAEIHAQLERFPEDLEGQMMLAELQADDLHDLEAARLTVERFVNQPHHAPKNVSFALTRLADWELKYAKDPEAARELFERIVDLHPDSTESHLAHQRIARLPTAEMLAEKEHATVYALPMADPSLGVRQSPGLVEEPANDPALRATELVAQLEKFPNDNQAREDLAIAYARELSRMDLAVGQLEQLIAQPHAPDKEIVRWLNLLAELHTREATDVAAAKLTLQRIVDRYPESAAAETAKRRMATVKLETRSKKQSQVVKLGSYPRNIGLTGKRPN